VDVLIGWPGGDWQSTLKIAGALVGGYLFVLWVASVLWVYKDIRSRTRDPISHLTAAAIAIVFPLIGLPVYFVLRPSETLSEAYARQLEQEAILSDLHAVSACPNCRRPVQDDFMICAHCATPLKQPCTNCGQLLAFSWRNCPYCATPRETARPQPRPAAEPARAQRGEPARERQEERPRAREETPRRGGAREESPVAPTALRPRAAAAGDEERT
jgi:RNA polymerase subunit RPABC4/transcription elongation factor Spt4